MMKSMVFRLMTAGACAVALQGCAILGIGGGNRVASVPTSPPAASDSAERYAATSGPTGLMRCKKANVNAQGCWRRSDAHVVYPASSPGGVEPTSAAYATPVPVKASKKK